MHKQPLRIILLVVFFYAFLFLTWEAAVRFFKVSPLVMIRPSEIIPVAYEYRASLLTALFYTFTEVILGWIVGNGIGLAAGVLLYRFRTVSSTFIRTSVLVNAVPVIALSAVVSGFLGSGPNSKIFITALLCFFPMVIVVLTSFTTVDQGLQNLFKTYHSSEKQLFAKFILPRALPAILTTLRLNVITAIFAAVVSEFFGAYGGIGPLILANKGMYNLPVVWAAVLYIVVAGSCFYLLLAVVQKKVVFWR